MQIIGSYISRHREVFFVSCLVFLGILWPILGLALLFLNGLFAIFITFSQVLSGILSPKIVSPDPPLHSEPLISVHIACHYEPSKIVKKTLASLAMQNYKNFEVIVVDNNTYDSRLWHPIRDYCAELGSKFRFFHVEQMKGFKAGALNLALKLTNPEAEFVSIIDSDYELDPTFLSDSISYFTHPDIALVQYPQNYSNVYKENEGLALEYQAFFSGLFEQANRLNATTGTGTLSVFRYDVLKKEVERWNENSITEDADIGTQLNEQGYRVIFVNKNLGQGLMPLDYFSLRRQRERWSYGNTQVFLRRAMPVIKNKLLSLGQKYALASQLAAWIHPLAFPVLLLVFLFFVAFWFDHQLFTLLSLVSIITIYIFFFGKMIYFITTLKRQQALSIVLLGKVMASHFGLTTVMSLSWIKALLKQPLSYNRTSKDPSERIPLNIPTELIWSSLVVLSSAIGMLQRDLFLVGFLGFTMGIFLIFSNLYLQYQLRATKLLTKRMLRS